VKILAGFVGKTPAIGFLIKIAGFAFETTRVVIHVL
jgi:hypothetical protein